MGDLRPTTPHQNNRSKPIDQGMIRDLLVVIDTIVLDLGMIGYHLVSMGTILD